MYLIKNNISNKLIELLGDLLSIQHTWVSSPYQGGHSSTRITVSNKLVNDLSGHILVVCVNGSIL